MSRVNITCVEFRPRRKGALVGFADVKVAEVRLLIRDVAVFQKGDRRWVGLPAKSKLAADGTVVKDPKTGKVAYATILEFDNSAVASAFSQAVIDAVLKLDEHALDKVPLEDVVI